MSVHEKQYLVYKIFPTLKYCKLADIDENKFS